MNTKDHDDLLLKAKKAIELINQGDLAFSKKLINNTPAEKTNNCDVLLMMGDISFALGMYSQSIDYFTKANNLQDDNAYSHYKIAEMMLSMNNDETEIEDNIIKAKYLLERSISIDKNYPDPYIKLAQIEMLNSNFDTVIKLLEKANKLKPDDFKINVNLSYALRQCDRHVEALAYAKNLVQIRPDAPESYQELGRILIELGKTNDAMFYLEQAIKINKTAGMAYVNLASIKKYTPKDLPLIKQIESNLQLSMPSRQRYPIHFSLGKMYDDCNDTDMAFNHYKKANLLAKPPSDPKAEQLIFKKIKKAYSKKFIEKLSCDGNTSDIPVFVIGMPRSGSTLIEQIISSHPKGAGAGELETIDSIDKSIVIRGKKNNYTNEVRKNLTHDSIVKYTRKYLDVLQKNRNGAHRIVDKMPDNFLHLGLINILFPNAKIIHSIRNPLDTCLSCYFQPFAFHPWSYDLKWTANRYRFYRNALNYWKTILPEGKIMEIQYEELVDNPHAKSRELISMCGLEWNDKCLEFYKEKRAINTASLWQARQPIYTTSRKRWTRYTKHLTDIAQDLADYLTDEDIEEFNKIGMRIKKKKAWSWW